MKQVGTGKKAKLRREKVRKGKTEEVNTNTRKRRRRIS